MKMVEALILVSLLVTLSTRATAQLSENHYANICPNVESLVQGAVRQMMSQSPIAAAATLRLFSHDCFVQGCDASIMIQKANGDDEQKNFHNQFLRVDGYNTINAAKAAVDADPQCANKVSCADIIALAARDAVVLTGGPSWKVELGRYDGTTSTESSVNVVPVDTDNLDQLNSRFAAYGLTQTDMIALSGAHTLGATSCFFVNPRLYPVDSTLDPGFASQLMNTCPSSLNVNSFVFFDQTVNTFDNNYFLMLQQKKGVLFSDEVLYTDSRSQSTVDQFAANQNAFFNAFTSAMLKLGRVGVKGAANGEIRKDCRFTN